MMNYYIKQSILCCFIIFNLFLVGCKDNSEPVVSREEISCFVTTDINLRSTAGVVDTTSFDPDNPTTFNSSVGSTFFDIFGQSYFLQAYFLKVDEQLSAWDVYFFIDDIPIDIESGVIGGNNQYKAQLQFDADGQLAAIIPELIKSEDIILSDEIYFYIIEFNFAKFYTTQFDSNFSAGIHQNVCYIQTT